jgi:hypothetical protein
MAKVKPKIKVWYDQEGDYLEVLFDASRAGYFRETGHEQVMEKVDVGGRLLGFSIMKVSHFKKKPLEVSLA